MKSSLLPALALLMGSLTAPALADTAEAEAYVRAGSPVKALMVLDAADNSPAALFWRGRALIDLGRYEEAYCALESVPAGHELTPYAQRALIYCAWQSPLLDFPATIAPLTESADLSISRLATAALAEYELRRADAGSSEALRDIQTLAAAAPEWMLASRLLEIESLRQQRRFEDALTLCRLLEADKSLSQLARQRVRLALSEIYYAREQQQAEAGEATAAASPAVSLPAVSLLGGKGDDEPEQEADEGKGEETLLQFIASNPDSPLLGEAFRRLAQHGAFERGEYAIGKLEEWMQDPAKPRRAALALRVRQLMLHRATRPGQAPDATCVNLASSLLPREPMTAQMLREQVRVLVQQGRRQEAHLYHRMLPSGSAHSLFYDGLDSVDSTENAMDAFLGSALVADENLRPAALVNALLGALVSGNTEEAARIMAEQHPRNTRAALLSARASWFMSRDAAAARRDLEEWTSLYADEEAPVDAILDLALLELDAEPAKAAERLKELSERRRETWTVAQELRYYALLIEAANRGKSPGDPQAALAVARRATQEGSRADVRAYMELKLASMLTAQGRPGDALMRLERFAARNPERPEVPRALLMAGHAAAGIGSLPSQRRAAGLYARCAEIDSPYTVRAKLYRASVLTRISRRAEGRAIIEDLLKQEQTKPLEADDKALARCFLADSWSMEGTDEGLEKARQAMDDALADPELPPCWHYRMRMQHAIFCSRQGRHEEALADYMSILNSSAVIAGAPSQADWYTLYSAGAGAIYQHMQLKQYTEAANLAERIANWRSGSPAMSRPGGPSAERFAQWASSIRRVHPTDRF